MKNLVPLCGIPMLDFGIRAALAAARIDRVVCSTDKEAITLRAQHHGIEVIDRPAEFATDDASVVDVARHLLEQHECAEWPEVLVLIQPTSPFLLARHCDNLVSAMLNCPQARSGQTVVPVPHNHHAMNQRIVENGFVRFRSPEQRRASHNKQRKEKLHVFGNLVAARPEALMTETWFFAEPSVAIEIERPYDLDVDGTDDVILAEALITANAVDLPHMADYKFASRPTAATT